MHVSKVHIGRDYDAITTRLRRESSSSVRCSTTVLLLLLLLLLGHHCFATPAARRHLVRSVADTGRNRQLTWVVTPAATHR